jgi:hypothetical protein
MRLAQRLWPAYAGLCAVILAAGLPRVYAARLAACPPEACYEFQLTAEQIEVLRQSGMSLRAHATYTTLLSLADTAVTYSIAAILFWRRRNHPVALLLAFITVSHGTNVSEAAHILEDTYPGLWPLLRVIPMVVAAGNLPLWSVFPTGRFVPGWTRWLVPVAIAMGVVVYVPWLSAPGTLGRRLLNVWWAVWLLGSVFLQLYRYVRSDDTVQRQQVKWYLYSTLISAPLIAGMNVAAAWVPDLARPGTLANTAQNVLYFLGVTISLGALLAAMLRYRLWDIDVIIRRTLIYSALTTVLGLAYLGSVLVLQSVFQALTGEGQSPLVVALSTLAIAALFGPVRGRVQAGIDKRFYRRKYDAAKALASFGAQARDVVELEQLSGQLLRVVEETMQPAHVGVWLAVRSVSHRSDPKVFAEPLGVSGRWHP